MKNGLMIYYRSINEGYFNVGDYIQSIAARQFFDKIDLYIERDALNEYEGEDIKLIMNGWFMHYPDNWPPTSKIKPLLIAFHMNNWLEDRMLTYDGISFFKQNEPVGCRDHYTVERLRKKGIDAYFSGCLTLTLGLTYKRQKNNDKIYFVEPHYKLTKKNKLGITSALLTLIVEYNTIWKLNKKVTGINSLKYLLKTAFFYRSYKKLFEKEVLLNAEYVYQIASEKNFVDEDAKFDYADGLLKKYCEGAFVVTSRIHCALPCLGMNVPVLYVYDENQIEGSSSRLEGMSELLHLIKYDEGKLSIEMDLENKKINKDFSFVNKTDYIKLKEVLIHKCKEFLKWNQ
jgi:hypothetical protein